MKKTLSLIMVFTLILTLMVPAMGASILTATASANPTRYLDFNPMNSGDVTKGFMNIGGNTMTMIDGKLEVVPGGAGTGVYYGPASEYGGMGNGKIYNGILSFNYAVDFKAGANDWGSTIQFRTNDAGAPWTITSGFYLLIRPDVIILYKAGGVLLDIVYKPLVNLAEYKFRISFIDNASGNCDIKVTIKDSNNQLYQNDGSTTGYSLMADNVAGSAVAGYVTLFGNNAQINKYIVSPGTTETFSQATPYNFSNLSASKWSVTANSGYSTDNGKITITTANSTGLAAIRFKGDGSSLKNDFTNTEYNFRLKMKFKDSTAGGDWGLLACFAAKDPSSAPWVASGQDCYTFQMNKTNNLLIKTTESSVNTSFTPSMTSSSGVINDNLFHDIKITTVQNSYNDLSKITVSVDGIELYNFVDVAPLKAGGFFLLLQDSALDAFELDTLDNAATISYTIRDGYLLSGLAENMSDTAFLAGITLSPGAVAGISNKVGNNVGTGAKLQITYLGIVDNYTIILKGDNDGDGDIAVSDLANLKLDLLRMGNLNNITAYASDVNRDNTLTISDLLAVKKHLLNISLINQG